MAAGPHEPVGVVFAHLLAVVANLDVAWACQLSWPGQARKADNNWEELAFVKATGVGLVIGLVEWLLAVAADAERGGWQSLRVVGLCNLIEALEQPCCLGLGRVRVGTQPHEHGAELVFGGVLDAGGRRYRPLRSIKIYEVGGDAH